MASHPQLVAQHQDVILACIDDPDISIRLQALQLGSGMITSENLQLIVDRLRKQLHEARQPTEEEIGPSHLKSIEPAADSDGEDPEETLQRDVRRSREAQVMPMDYRAAMIRQILEMCSRNTYINIIDFNWYVDTLVDLVHVLPSQIGESTLSNDVAAAVGMELRTVAVRVVSTRPYAVQAANLLLIHRETLASVQGSGISSLVVMEYAAWIVGEYASTLEEPAGSLDALVLLPRETSRSELICAYLQATIKVLSVLLAEDKHYWNDQLQAGTSLILARIIQFIERFVDHPSLEVQERAVGFMELVKLAQEAVDGHDRSATSGPLLTTVVLPSLFNGQELNPVAISAQRKVPLPEDIDLNVPINDDLAQLLQEADKDALSEAEVNPTKIYYYQKPELVVYATRPAIESIPDIDISSSYQNNGSYTSDAALKSIRKAERRERNRDDPFYIPSSETSGRNTPIHEILKTANDYELEVDSIPIMELNLGDTHTSFPGNRSAPVRKRNPVQVMAEETFDGELSTALPSSQNKLLKDNLLSRSSSKGLLQVDSSNIGSLSLSSDDAQSSEFAPPSDDAEMVKALANVEELRMEMQRAAERVLVSGDAEPSGTLVKKKKKKKKQPAEGEEQVQIDEQAEGAVVGKKKKKKKPKETASIEKTTTSSV